MAMNGQQYITTQMRLIEIGKLADSLDLDEFLKCISNAESVGPVIDPTTYIKAMDNLRAIRRLAEAVVPVKAAFEETFKAVMKTQVAGFMKANKD